DPRLVRVRQTTTGFFPMFEVPMLYGHAWSESDDDKRARVVVISRELNDKLFGGKDSTGRHIRVNVHDMRIVGVMNTWRPNPHFHAPTTVIYGCSEDVFMPLTGSRDLKIGHDGSMDCWGKGMTSPDKLETAQCVWLQFWVELDTPAKAASYKPFL